MKSDIQRRRLRKPTSRNALGVLGVNKVGRQFRSRLELGDLKLHLGYYPSPDDAECPRTCPSSTSRSAEELRRTAPGRNERAIGRPMTLNTPYSNDDAHPVARHFEALVEGDVRLSRDQVNEMVVRGALRRFSAPHWFSIERWPKAAGGAALIEREAILAEFADFRIPLTEALDRLVEAASRSVFGSGEERQRLLRDAWIALRRVRDVVPLLRSDAGKAARSVIRASVRAADSAELGYGTRRELENAVVSAWALAVAEDPSRDLTDAATAALRGDL